MEMGNIWLHNRKLVLRTEYKRDLFYKKEMIALKIERIRAFFA